MLAGACGCYLALASLSLHHVIRILPALAATASKGWPRLELAVGGWQGKLVVGRLVGKLGERDEEWASVLVGLAGCRSWSGEVSLESHRGLARSR